MPRLVPARSSMRWLVALLIVLVAAGSGWAWIRVGSKSDPVALATSAYRSGDWLRQPIWRVGG